MLTPIFYIWVGYGGVVVFNDVLGRRLTYWTVLCFEAALSLEALDGSACKMEGWGFSIPDDR